NVAPVAEKRVVAGGRTSQVIEHTLQLRFANAFHKVLEHLARLTISEVSLGESADNFGDVPGRNRHYRKPVRPGVLLPLAAEHYLKVRHRMACDLTTHAVETEIGYVMLA